MKRTELKRSVVPLKRSGPPRKKAKAKTAGWYRNQATDVWSKYIHARDKVCQVCGKADGVLHAHHMMVRSFNSTRTDEGNGVLCCFRCHRYFFHGTDPFKVTCWYSDHLGVDGYQRLRDKAYLGVQGRYGVEFWKAEKARLSALLAGVEDQ